MLAYSNKRHHTLSNIKYINQKINITYCVIISKFIIRIIRIIRFYICIYKIVDFVQ
jgi:hypothetical protein